MNFNSKNIPFEKIEVIIFDLGGVILDIDINETLRAFAKLKIEGFGYHDIIAEDKSLFLNLELGLITPDAFIEAFKNDFPTAKHIPESEIWAAWNALLLNYKKERLDLIKEIKKHYKTYLLSNTNYPHRIAYTHMLNKEFNEEYTHLFDKCYFSDEMHLRKPDPEIYEQVTNDLQINPEKILFIDDNLTNIQQAQAAGWNAYHLTDGEQITDLFSF